MELNENCKDLANSFYKTILDDLDKELNNCSSKQDFLDFIKNNFESSKKVNKIKRMVFKETRPKYWKIIIINELLCKLINKEV